jgi:hypothetical protein
MPDLCNESSLLERLHNLYQGTSSLRKRANFHEFLLSAINRVKKAFFLHAKTWKSAYENLEVVVSLGETKGWPNVILAFLENGSETLSLVAEVHVIESEGFLTLTLFAGTSIRKFGINGQSASHKVVDRILQSGLDAFSALTLSHSSIYLPEENERQPLIATSSSIENPYPKEELSDKLQAENDAEEELLSLNTDPLASLSFEESREEELDSTYQSIKVLRPLKV